MIPTPLLSVDETFDAVQGLLLSEDSAWRPGPKPLGFLWNVSLSDVTAPGLRRTGDERMRKMRGRRRRTEWRLWQNLQAPARSHKTGPPVETYGCCQRSRAES